MSFKKRIPLPSPIPTAKGSRSAANDTLNDYLIKSSHIPDLILPPEPNFPTGKRQPSPAVIDFPLIESGDCESIERLLRSAMEFGVVRIAGHGISGQGLHAFVQECELVFRISGEDRIEFRQDLGGLEERTEWIRERIGTGTYRDFCQKVENVANKLNATAEQVSRVLLEKVDNVVKERESILSLHRYEDLMEEKSLLGSLKLHALCFHLPVRHCRIGVRTARGSFSFDAGPDTIVVSVGQQLEEMSRGEFKSVLREEIYEPKFHGSQVFFSMKLKSSFGSSSCKETQMSCTSSQRISIIDQIFYALVISLLCKIVFHFFT